MNFRSAVLVNNQPIFIKLYFCNATLIFFKTYECNNNIVQSLCGIFMYLYLFCSHDLITYTVRQAFPELCLKYSPNFYTEAIETFNMAMEQKFCKLLWSMPSRDQNTNKVERSHLWYKSGYIVLEIIVQTTSQKGSST